LRNFTTTDCISRFPYTGFLLMVAQRARAICLKRSIYATATKQVSQSRA
jgi:hypothetical protein